MKDKQQQLSVLLKNIGKITVNVLPDILTLVPMYGPILGKVLEKTLNIHEEKGNEITNADILKKLDLLINAINEKKIKEEEVNAIMEKSVVDCIEENSQRTSIYMFGIMIYTTDDSRMEEESAKTINSMFSKEGTTEESFYEEKVNEIREFLFEYTNIDSSSENDYYYLSPKSLIINFEEKSDDPSDKILRNEQKIINFIANLNIVLNGEVFWDYTIV